MRVQYGDLIDFEIEKRGENRIWFRVNSQHPATVNRDKDPSQIQEMRETYYYPFNAGRDLKIDSETFPEIAYEDLFLLGNGVSVESVHHFDTEERDAHFDLALSTLREWSEFPPCRLLWQSPYKHTQLRLL